MDRLPGHVGRRRFGDDAIVHVHVPDEIHVLKYFIFAVVINFELCRLS